MSLPKPKAPSSLIRISRWTMLSLGIVYGIQKNREYGKKEAELRAKEAAERPAKEAARKAEKDRKYREEMDYLGRETGVLPPGGSSGPAIGGAGDYKSDCGCNY